MARKLCKGGLVEKKGIVLHVEGRDGYMMKPKDLPLTAYMKELERELKPVLGCGADKWRLSYYRGEHLFEITTARDIQVFYEYAGDAHQEYATLYIKPPKGVQPAQSAPVPPPPYQHPPASTSAPTPMPSPPNQHPPSSTSAPTPSVAGVVDGMKAAAKSKLMELSDGFRTRWKELLSVKETSEEALAKASGELEDRGYHSFESKAIVWEELGISGGRWEQQVDNLIAMGLPQNIGDTMKIAIGNKRGSKKSAYASTWVESQNTMSWNRLTYYIKFQIIPVDDEHDEFDVVIALNQNVCSITGDTKGTTAITGSQAELAFKKYIRLDSEVQFKEEVQQLI